MGRKSKKEKEDENETYYKKEILINSKGEIRIWTESPEAGGDLVEEANEDRYEIIWLRGENNFYFQKKINLINSRLEEIRREMEWRRETQHKILNIYLVAEYNKLVEEKEKLIEEYKNVEIVM